MRAVVAPAFAPRVFFLIAAAFVAAGVADPLVESISNTGIFGGHYADNNHLCVLPTILLGAAIAVQIVALRCVDAFRSVTGVGNDWLLNVAKTFSQHGPGRDVPYVVALQLVALFVLESIEQVAVGGKLLGGTAWLGGPVVFSLLAHILVGAGCTFVLGALMRAIVRTFASLVHTALAYVWLAAARATARCLYFRGLANLCLRAQSPHVRDTGGRAPPLLPIPA